jgi:hypothetical protein
MSARLGLGHPAHVDLASDGGGDQSGSALLQEVDGSLGFSGEGVKFCIPFFYLHYNCSLLGDRRQCKPDVSYVNKMNVASAPSLFPSLKLLKYHVGF